TPSTKSPTCKPSIYPPFGTLLSSYRRKNCCAGGLRRYKAAFSNASGESRNLPRSLLHCEHKSPRMHFPHDVGPLQHEWSWSTASRRALPVAVHMKHLPPWYS